MRRTLLLLSIASLVSVEANAQCTPDVLYADSVYGVWPDTTENFMDGVVGIFYSDTLDLIVPTNAEDIPSDPPYPPVDIDSVQVESVDGLPPGLSISCNSQTAGPCTYLSSVLGCGLIEGTPTTVGTFPITLNVRAFFTFFFTVQSLPASFGGYEITIDVNTGLATLAPSGLGNVRNVPNPFASRTNIEFQSGRSGEARVRVFDLLGEEIWDQTFQAKTGNNRVPFEGGDLPAGVYLYKIESGAATFTGRMALQR